MIILLTNSSPHFSQFVKPRGYYSFNNKQQNKIFFLHFMIWWSIGEDLKIKINSKNIKTQSCKKLFRKKKHDKKKIRLRLSSLEKFPHFSDFSFFFVFNPFYSRKKIRQVVVFNNNKKKINSRNGIQIIYN